MPEIDVSPSFHMRQVKVPTQDARIRWGLGRPNHKPDAQNFSLKSNEGEKSLASEWAKTIKEKGAAYIHGKLNSYWFDDSQEPIATGEPGFGDYGQINMPIKNSHEGGSPTGIIESQLETTDMTDKTGHFNERHKIQYLLLSQPVDPNYRPNQELIKQHGDLIFKEGIGGKSITQEMQRESNIARFNQLNEKTLSGKFTSAWREISWTFWADKNQTKIGAEQQDMVSWRNGQPLQVLMKVLLESHDAEKMFAQMQSHPEELSRLLHELYPKIDGEYPLKTIKSETLKAFKDAGPVEMNQTEMEKQTVEIPLK